MLKCQISQGHKETKDKGRLVGEQMVFLMTEEYTGKYRCLWNCLQDELNYTTDRKRTGMKRTLPVGTGFPKCLQWLGSVSVHAECVRCGSMWHHQGADFRHSASAKNMTSHCVL